MADPVRVDARSLEETRRLLAGLLPEGHGLSPVEVTPTGLVCEVDALEVERALGGSVSGPAVFRIVDMTAFLALNSFVGRMPSAVLAQCSISLLEAPEPVRLLVAAEVVQVAARTAVTTAQVRDGTGRLVSMATLHFALPTRRPRTSELPPSQSSTASDRTA